MLLGFLTARARADQGALAQERDLDEMLDGVVGQFIDGGASHIDADDLAAAWPAEWPAGGISAKALLKSIERVGETRHVEIVGLCDLTTWRYTLERIDPATADMGSRFSDAVRRRLQCRVRRLCVGDIPRRYWDGLDRVRASRRLERVIETDGPSVGCSVAYVLESAAPVFGLAYDHLPPDSDGDVDMRDN